MLFKVEETLKKYNKISMFLDNDSNGEFIKSKIYNQYNNVEDCSLIYQEFKDLNEWYCSNVKKLGFDVTDTVRKN